MIRRYIRLAWVVCLNGFTIYFHVQAMHENWQLYHLLETRPPLREFVGGSVGILILTTGIVCEVFRVKVAKYINVSYFLIVGTLYTLFGIVGHHDREAWALFPLIGLPALAGALVTLAFYWERNTPEAQRELGGPTVSSKP